MKIGKDHNQLRTHYRTLTVALMLAIPVTLLLAGCSTATPAPTSTPTIPTETPTPEPQGTPEATREPLIPLDDDPVLGSPDAPVTMIEYSEYLCPYCRRFTLETMPQIEEEYIDKGQVKLVFRDFPVHGEPAWLLAMVAECAGEQSRFWEMHKLLFERVEEWSKSEDILATFRAYAKEVGGDPDELESCLRQNTPVDGIREDYNVGVQDGVSGTPAFLINGTLVVGAQPFDEFQRVIEEQLAKSG